MRVVLRDVGWGVAWGVSLGRWLLGLLGAYVDHSSTRLLDAVYFLDYYRALGSKEGWNWEVFVPVFERKMNEQYGWWSGAV